MKESFYDTPILFLIFNRPDTTQQVFDVIKNVRPSNLFVAADGPRRDNKKDYEQCQKARDIINQVDWQCDIHILFHPDNLGCKAAISAAITWFFNHVEEGIILEDDCVPDPSFFSFCQEILKRYRDTPRVMMVCGMNYMTCVCDLKESYFFSKYYPVWGWATWKRAWQYYDITMKKWPELKRKGFLRDHYSDKRVISHFTRIFQSAHENLIDTWDIQWLYSCLVKDGLAVIPKWNLVSNIGTQGTHSTGESSVHHLKRFTMNTSNLVHPKEFPTKFPIDDEIFQLILGINNSSFFQKIQNSMWKLWWKISTG